MKLKYDSEIQVWWVCENNGEEIVGFDTEEEAEERLEEYRIYRAENQTETVRRQCASLMK